MCTKSRALRSAMKEVWKLPSEDKYMYTGENCLQTLLDTVNDEDRAKLLLLFWRSWHLREDCIRNGGKETIGSSKQFLLKLEEELRTAVDLVEGTGRKDILVTGSFDESPGVRPLDKWLPPDMGIAKINTDAAFLAESGESAAGAVGRDHRGRFLISICSKLLRCQSAEEAEARATLAGLQAMSEHFNGQIILEMDKQMVVNERRHKP